jgi:SAM-dependent methyltransferase
MRWKNADAPGSGKARLVATAAPVPAGDALRQKAANAIRVVGSAPVKSSRSANTLPRFARRVLELWRLATDGAHRGAMWLHYRNPKQAFQPYNCTSENRYPHIFAALQSRLGSPFDGRVLSFGCSTGEEVFTLRRYFPHAFIKGIDINSGNIAVCAKRLKLMNDDRIAFEVSDTPARELAGSYDAILCMAVLRHGALGAPGVASCEKLIRFEDFARTVEDFSRCLRPGGLLVIRHSNFRFCDAPAYSKFETILALPHSNEAVTPIFGPDNCLMEGEVYRDTIFRKALR